VEIVVTQGWSQALGEEVRVPSDMTIDHLGDRRVVAEIDEPTCFVANWPSM